MISYQNHYINHLTIEPSEQKYEDEITFRVENLFYDDDFKFQVIFNMLIKNELYTLEVSAVFNFKLEDTNAEFVWAEFKESHFPKINAPAIAYPFLRSYISNITLLSGYKPIILPTVNFQQIHSEAQS